MQGVCEPLPVSSSAHLLLLRTAAGWRGTGRGATADERVVDVALHAGSALAAAVLLRADLLALARGLRRGEASAWSLVLTPLPAAVVGGPLAPLVHRRLAAPRPTAALLAGVGLTAVAAERWRPPPPRERLVPVPGDAAALGLAQTVALVPGVSRTLAASTALRRRGLDDAVTARVVALTGLPAVVAALVRSGPALGRLLAGERSPAHATVRRGDLLAGAAASAAGTAVVGRVVLSGRVPSPAAVAAERCAAVILAACIPRLRRSRLGFRGRAAPAR